MSSSEEKAGLPPRQPSVDATLGGADDEAEDTVVSLLETRRRRERPPAFWGQTEAQRDILPSVPDDAPGAFAADGSAVASKASSLSGASSGEGGADNRRRRVTLAGAARRVISAKRIKRVQESIRQLGGVSLGSTTTSPPKVDDLVGSAASGESPFRDMMFGTSVKKKTHHRAGSNSADRLFDDLLKFEEVFRRGSELVQDSPEENFSTLPRHFTSSRTNPGCGDSEADSRNAESTFTDEETGSRRSEKARLLPERAKSLIMRSVMVHNPLTDVLGPKVVCRNVVSFLRTTFLLVMVPCLVAAYFLFEHGNPELQFLPTDASLSWWFIFFVRQLVMLQLAICTEYLVVDCFAFRLPLATRIMGPLLTLYTTQAHGWPFVLSSWGLWDLVMLHGTHVFCRNWLFFLGIPIFSDANPHGSLINSEVYLRVLLSLVIFGICVGIKRTFLALYLSRRTFRHYKPRLEKIMESILYISEVADLAVLTETREFEKAVEMEAGGRNSRPTLTTKLYGSQKWGRIRFEGRDTDSSSESDAESIEIEVDPEQLGITCSSPSFYAKEAASQNVKPCVSDSCGGSRKKIKRADSDDTNDDAFRARYLHRNENRNELSGSLKIKIKDLLDRWVEPENKLEVAAPASIHDILLFRKALSYMDDTHPFGNSFGASDTRDRCVRSAQRVYKRLMKYVPEAEFLPFEVIEALAYDDHGSVDHEKRQELETLFRAGRDETITPLSFVQTCDRVYKKLRFFRAAVANSSLIDQVLEEMFNFFFYAILWLVIISGVMDCDAWSLLVSISTLMVSLSFAVGASISKYVEGVLLIAVRRPYDLGDRISVTSSDAASHPDGSLSWFVEDVNLYTTTLRFAATNEVSTVNNGAIANSRIANLTRSPKALVTIELLFAIEASHEKMDLFKQAVLQYVKDNPRIWYTIIHFRSTIIDPDMQYAGYSLRMQHMKSWQDMPQVLDARGNLMNFCVEVMEQLGIVYASPGKPIRIEMNEKTEEGNGVASDIGRPVSGERLAEFLGDAPKTHQ